MSRPVDRQKRKDLALSALEVLQRQGLQSSTMSSLAKELGIKRPTLYFYFPSIPHLLRTSLELLREEEVSYVLERVRGVDHPLDLLDAFLRAEHDFVMERGVQEVMLLMAQVWASGEGADRDSFRQVATRELFAGRAMLVAALSYGIERGIVAPCDPEAVVDLILALQDGAALHAGLREVNADAIFDLVRDRVLQPLRVQPTAPSGDAG